MCYDDNAQPPVPQGATATARGEDVVLSADDGNRFAAYVAQPSTAATAQVLILPDIRGLHQFYKDLALRFAELGIAAISMDYFGRTAGLTSRDESFEFMPHVQQLQLPTFFADVRAALAHIQSETELNGETFTVGFCMGGTFSYLAGTQDFDLAGVIGFYAGLSRNFGGGGTLLEQAANVRVPSLGLFGGADQGIPTDQVHALDDALDQTGALHRVIIYEGAPHSFFDRRATDYAEASADAWRQVIEFINERSNAGNAAPA